MRRAGKPFSQAEVDEHVAALLRLILDRPGISLAEIRKIVPYSKPTINRFLGTLIAAGKIVAKLDREESEITHMRDEYKVYHSIEVTP